jgi:hypothetical protein
MTFRTKNMREAKTPENKLSAVGEALLNRLSAIFVPIAATPGERVIFN